jgi:hypothetical protein
MIGTMKKSAARAIAGSVSVVADDMIADAKEHGDSSLDKSYVLDHVVDSLGESPEYALEVVREINRRGFLNRYN